ncbi:hypothetical protein BM1374166_00638 [Bartonella tribocorum]|nr:hypothetical protein BM1374166_00638 [Bartonella tribocorum]
MFVVRYKSDLPLKKGQLFYIEEAKNKHTVEKIKNNQYTKFSHLF